MTGRILAVSTLVALAHAKAIITNNCATDVYIWSVPNVGSAYANNLQLSPNSSYEEPWRHGSSQNPGIALKVSPEPNGIHTGKDEINFAYSVDHPDKSKVWTDLSTIRGRPFDGKVVFHTCKRASTLGDVQPQKCEATDNIELVLCGSTARTRSKDSRSFDMIAECYDYHRDNSQEHMKHHSSPACTSCPPAPTSSHQSSARVSSHQYSSYVSSVKTSSCATITVTHPLASPLRSTICATTTVTDYATTKTKTYQTPSKHTSDAYARTSRSLYSPLSKPSSDRPYSPPLTSEKPHPPPGPSYGGSYERPKPTTEYTHAPPPQYTPHRPSYQSHGDRPVPAATEDESRIPRPTPYGGDRWGRSAQVYNKKAKPTPRSLEYCEARTVYRLFTSSPPPRTRKSVNTALASLGSKLRHHSGSHIASRDGTDPVIKVCMEKSSREAESLCELLEVSEDDCDVAETSVERLAQELGYSIEYSTDDDADDTWCVELTPLVGNSMVVAGAQNGCCA